MLAVWGFGGIEEYMLDHWKARIGGIQPEHLRTLTHVPVTTSSEVLADALHFLSRKRILMVSIPEGGRNSLR